MSNTPELVKLAGLRAKTDQDLMAIIESALERGLSVARQDGHAFDYRRREVDKAYAQVAELLPLVYGLSRSERRRFKMRLAELRSALDDSSGRDADAVRAAGI